MAMNIDRVYKNPSRARLFDRPIQGLQDALGRLSWLDHVFGRCERLVKDVDGRRVYTPNVYYEGEEYLLLTPDNRELGNYCFFVMEDPQTVTMSLGERARLRTPYSLIVWVDMRTVEGGDERNTEAVKEALLSAVRSAWLRSGAVSVERVYERAENVFQGFSIDEVDSQFLMAPFAGWRLTGELWVDEECVTI